MDRPIEAVLAAFEAKGLDVREQHGRWMAQCSAHEDRTPSLGISEAADGRVLLKCYAGCTSEDVISEVGLTLADLFPRDERREPPRPVPQVPAREVAHYVYHDAAGQPWTRVVRYEPKQFRQQRWEGGRWQWGLGDRVPVLYRLPQVLAALERNEVVWVCEGEKDADRIVAEGHCATTMPMGAGKWRDEYTEVFGPQARVIICADDDPPGHKHAADVHTRLYGRVGRVWSRLPAEGCKDMSDHLDAGHKLTNADLRPLPGGGMGGDASASSSNGAGPQMFTAKVFAARPAPDRALRVVGPLFQRGMRTTLGAQTGEGKTTLALQAIKSLVTGEPFLDSKDVNWRPLSRGRALIVDLEQGEETVKQRLREAELDNTEAVDVLWEPAGLALDSDPSHQALIRDTVRQGRYDLVLLDPLYQMHRGDGNNERIAADLMRVVDGWAREFGFSLVIPMHARKPHPMAGSRFTINDIAGSGTWNRNAEFVCGIKFMSTGNSRLHFFKDRVGHGPDIGSHWWLSFDRSAGFHRTYKEDKDAQAKRYSEMLNAAEGATEDDLRAAGADDVTVKRLLKKAHVNDAGRWRKEPWEQQTTLGADVT